MSKQIYLPPRLTLLPLPKPHVLYPFLQTTVSLPQEVVGHLLATLSETSETSKADSRERFVAAVPVADGDRRLGRWACGKCGRTPVVVVVVAFRVTRLRFPAARVKRLYRSKDSDGEDGDVWMCVLEGLVST
jgi:hypothetical protein